MRKFLVLRDPFKFYGKQLFNYSEVEANNCREAVVKCREEDKDREIVAVKPINSIKWRREPTLIS
jgi:hypothetical protein